MAVQRHHYPLVASRTVSRLCGRCIFRSTERSSVVDTALVKRDTPIPRKDIRVCLAAFLSFLFLLRAGIISCPRPRKVRRGKLTEHSPHDPGWLHPPRQSYKSSLSVCRRMLRSSTWLFLLFYFVDLSFPARTYLARSRIPLRSLAAWHLTNRGLDGPDISFYGNIWAQL